MKLWIIALVVILYSLNFAIASPGYTGKTFYSVYKDKRYISSVPIATLDKSPDFDLATPTLPLSLSNIIDIALTQLSEITGTKTGWIATSITINNWAKNRGKWYYAIQFNTINYKTFYDIHILVTIDGRLGIIKESNK